MKTKFPEYLAKFRNERGYTQAQIAEKLGISRSTYANYESGNRSPDLETLECIGDVLGCSLDELFGRAAYRKSAVRDRRDCEWGSERGSEWGSDLGSETGTAPDWSRLYPDMLCEEKSPYHVNVKRAPEHKLAIGVQDFRFMRERNAYYVDKTQMIEEFLESWYQVTLITRPRRFGKTLNMSMIAEFLDCTKDSAELFAGTKVSGSRWISEMNRYPVVFLSFLNVKSDSVEGMLSQMSMALRLEYERYLPVIKESAISEEDRLSFQETYEALRKPRDAEGVRENIISSVFVLCRTLEAHYGQKVYLLLDEYDTPFISANAGGYYAEVREVLAGLMRSALKGNPFVEKALLTGIQRVAKENIFSGLNNLIVCTVADQEYGDCFGFTEEEVRDLLDYCGGKFTDEVKEMYDGYQIAGTELYNPWSVSCYAARGKAAPYWVNTSENSILKNALEQQGTSFAEDYNRLITDGIVSVRAELATAYYEKPDKASLWGLLINAGMLTIREQLKVDYFTLRVPNQEVWKAFQELTAFYLHVEEGTIWTMLYHLQAGEMERFADSYKKILLELPSYYDLKNENSYHMMMLGMCAFMQREYRVKSNQENGSGRGDILLYAKKPGYHNMVLEFKYTKQESQNLEDLAADALLQIREKDYAAGMDGEVYHIGLAHCGKRAEVRWEKE